MAKADKLRPQRTKEHINESKSYNFIEKFFIDKGHVIARSGADYGYDMFVTTFDAQGYAESGDIRIQLKASDDFDYVKKGSFVSYNISMKHYNLWTGEIMPVFLILYGATQNRAFWVDIAEYFSDPKNQPGADTKSVNIRVPVANVFTEATVDRARSLKSAIIARRKGYIAHGE